MVESIARIRFSWDSEQTKCHATAVGPAGETLAEVTVELSIESRSRIWATRGGSMQYRIEEAAERHLRAMLDLRY